MPCRLAISSMSLGRCFAGHSLDHKLDMAQLYGYRGIELFHEDLLDIADRLPGGITSANELHAAESIRKMCDKRGLAILCLQPFMNYEGLVDREEHERRLGKLALWFEIAKVLRTDIIQVPSNFLPATQLSHRRDVIVADLQKIADLALTQQPPIRFVYEALCWGTHCDTWEESWEIVKDIDRPNFGLCLDTFNIAGRIYADPASPSGCNANAEEAVRESIARLVSKVDIRKVFYIQVVDAERLSQPLVEGHPFYNADQPARMSWSRNCRLFYGEQEYGAYLPVTEIARAIFQGLGFEGWVSLELFNRRMADTDFEVVEELARRGAVSWAKLVRDVNLKVVEAPGAPRLPASL